MPQLITFFFLRLVLNVEALERGIHGKCHVLLCHLSGPFIDFRCLDSSQQHIHDMPLTTVKRMRRGIGAIDRDSDEEVDLDITAAIDASSDNIMLEPRLHTSKRPKVEHPRLEQVINHIHFSETQGNALPSDNIAQLEKDSQEDKKRKQVCFIIMSSSIFKFIDSDATHWQGASVMMEKFSKHFPDLQRSILYNTHHRSLGNPCECGSFEAIFRCAGPEKCSDPPLQCKSCIVQAHQSLPFHRIEVWSGTHFVMSSLHALNYILYLGHHGKRCPNLSTSTSPRPMTAVNTNGFHKISVHFCYCEGAASQAIQLSNQGYFPGTMVQPESIYSFAVLENFHAHTLSSKKSLYDYHDALVKITNAAFPQDVPVRAQNPFLFHVL